MSLAERSRPAAVDRFWRQVRAHPQRGHAYVSLLGLRTYETAELHARVREGLSYEAFEQLRSVLDLTASRAAELLQIPARTLARRKEAKRFEPAESDRLVRLSRLVGLALQLCEGDLGGTRAWLLTPNDALGGQTTLEFATTDIGAREVENVIGRLEHGIPL
ncbi:MAG TPA: antitoxin Xre-like helix-turn-helix domain-containing protein [Longimicrobiales bacterium]|nr:antitoxin Xre-like helix-turn-helix domain-containing protein [Longimicrobiales bacterium]